METDHLGEPYQQRTLRFGRDDEGPVVATLVRRRAPAATGRAVLWVHGWSDYFFQTHVADFFTDLGFDFYALDLRKHGRSLRQHQTPSFCGSLRDYFPELDEAVRIIREEDQHDRLVLAAHSTGALTAALWAHLRRPDRPVDAMFLNSPFFDLNLPSWVRAPGRATAYAIGRRRPYRVLRRPVYPVYGESLHSAHRGEWSYELAWKPIGGFPIRYGWLAAVHAGQQRLHAGLAIDVPVLVGCSAGSLRTLHWQERAREVDTVLNVADILRWSPCLGRHVTLVRFEGALHDLTLSAPPVRAAVFSELARWLDAYLASDPAPGARGPAATPERPRVVAPMTPAETSVDPTGARAPTPAEPTRAEPAASPAPSAPGSTVPGPAAPRPGTPPTAGAGAPADPG